MPCLKIFDRKKSGSSNTTIDFYNEKRMRELEKLHRFRNELVEMTSKANMPDGTCRFRSSFNNAFLAYLLLLIPGVALFGIGTMNITQQPDKNTIEHPPIFEFIAPGVFLIFLATCLLFSSNTQARIRLLLNEPITISPLFDMEHGNELLVSLGASAHNFPRTTKEVKHLLNTIDALIAERTQKSRNPASVEAKINQSFSRENTFMLFSTPIVMEYLYGEKPQTQKNHDEIEISITPKKMGS